VLLFIPFYIYIRSLAHNTGIVLAGYIVGHHQVLNLFIITRIDDGFFPYIILSTRGKAEKPVENRRKNSPLKIAFERFMARYFFGSYPKSWWKSSV